MARAASSAKAMKKPAAPVATEKKVAAKPAAAVAKARPSVVAKTKPAPVAAPKVMKAAPAKTPAKRKVKAPALKSITLRQFASAFAEEKGLSKSEGVTLVDEILGKIRTHIINGTKVRLAGFGNFEIRSRAARMGRNPATGEAIKIAASRKLVFKPSAELKDAV